MCRRATIGPTSRGETIGWMERSAVNGAEEVAVNREYVNPAINILERDTPTEEDVMTLINLQRVTVMEVARVAGDYGAVIGSPLNRRMCHNTPMTLSGPAAGHPLLRTAADPTGTQVLGTMNNCGSGHTLWGPYLNFDREL